MAFRELVLPLSITTSTGDPIRQFFNPVLSEAESYDVAVGFFSSAWIRDAAAGIARFARKGGKARWVVSPRLSAADYRTLKDAEGRFSRQEVEELVRQSFEALFLELQSRTRLMLGYLIADGIMEFRIGIPTNQLGGIMHAKMGTFKDAQGDRIGFSGSYNLTAGASTNWEKIDLYCSWKSEESQARIDQIESDFETMWTQRDPNLRIFHPSETSLQPFLQLTRQHSRPYELNRGSQFEVRIPARFLQDGKLRPYQEEAINEWFRRNGRGIFNMATGSGKTVTALASVTRLVEYAASQKAKLLAIVLVPYRHLADQWQGEAQEFGFEPIKCYESVNQWSRKAHELLLRLTAGQARQGMLVTVNETFSRPPFQRLIQRFRGNLCLVGDEMHNLGTGRLLKALPDSAEFRLGLSATPVRQHDEEGTSALEKYFGGQIFEFGIREAIEFGFLCEYYYHPVAIHLTDQEMEEYARLSLQISRLFVSGSEDWDENERLRSLLIKRARLIGKCANKLTCLIELLSKRKDSTYNVVYCGDSRDGDERHVEKALRLIGRQVGMRANKFTADESLLERREILRQFAAGELQTLVAIRCLDEGVDVPCMETAYILASSSNPRQFVQRRGRVLRRSPGKTATIYDFVAVPDLDRLKGGDSFNIERRLVRRELTRVNEFAHLALNKGEALRALRPIKSELHLLDI